MDEDLEKSCKLLLEVSGEPKNYIKTEFPTLSCYLGWDIIQLNLTPNNIYLYLQLFTMSKNNRSS